MKTFVFALIGFFIPFMGAGFMAWSFNPADLAKLDSDGRFCLLILSLFCSAVFPVIVLDLRGK